MKGKESMNGKVYVLGFICGLILVAVITIAIRLFARKKSCSDYDERQEAIRGRGFKYAYFSAGITLVLGGVIELFTDVRWCGLFTFAILTLWISICVFTTFCVIKDAFFTLRSHRRVLIAIFLIAGGFNLFIGLHRELISNGMLTLNASNLFSGVGCLYLVLMMLGRSIYERRLENEE